MIDTIYGAKSSAIIYSIVETTKVNNLKPYDYFKYLLAELPKHEQDTDFLKELLPWSEKRTWEKCMKIVTAKFLTLESLVWYVKYV